MPKLVLAAVTAVTLVLAGCSGNGGGGAAGSGEFRLDIVDSLAGGAMTLQGAYLRASSGDWRQALPDGTAYAFDGAGNASAAGLVPAGAYDRLRLLFDSVRSGDREALLTQSGVEVALNLTVSEAAPGAVTLAFAWPDSFFQSAQGLAFTPVLSLLVVQEGGVETARLAAAEIATGAGKAPVARMRVFDATGLEVFASTFVADSPEGPVVGNAGNLTFSATGSEALQPGATLQTPVWDIAGTTLRGNTVVWSAPIHGGNVTVRLMVEDSDGNADTQTVTMALKPATATRMLTFAGSASGAGGMQGVQEHTFPVDTETLDNASARLVHVRLTLSPGAATLPVSDLDVTLDDGAGARIGAATGSGSQHTIEADVQEAASGEWLVRVVPDPAFEAEYTVAVELTWKGVNPGMEAFLAQYDDGHTHTH